MNANRVITAIVSLLVVLAASLQGSAQPKKILKVTNTPGGSTSTAAPKMTYTPTMTRTATGTFTASATDTLVDTLTPTDTSVPTDTLTPTITPTTGAYIQPYIGAPLCPDSGTSHELTMFHTLWDGNRGCHYDHEHGTSPFTSEVAAAFPGFDLFALLGGVQIGHTNESSPAENTTKHGGFKWQVDLAAPHGCELGFEDGTVAVDAYAIEYHAFGTYSIEFEARNHSTAALLRQCQPSDPNDKGYIYVNQLQEFGQRVIPYQGFVLPYPDNYQPEYDSPSGPYFTADCIGSGLPGCRPDLNFIVSRDINTNSIWTSKPTGLAGAPRPATSKLFRLLFRLRDTYQVLDSSDLTHPFTWVFVCGNTSYNPVGCRYNNSTTTVQEIAGDIPSEWDNLSGFDSDPRVGRITAEGFVTRYGDLNMTCSVPGTDCHPIKMVSAFVGKYSSLLVTVKPSNPTPADTPERDIYFCNGVPCNETDLNAVPSGWIGANN